MVNHWISFCEDDRELLTNLGITLENEIVPENIYDLPGQEKVREAEVDLTDELLEKLDPYFGRFVWGPINKEGK